MSIVRVTKKNYMVEILESEQPVLLDFWADWCGPCQMITPIISQIAEERPDIKVCKVNVDAEPELAEEFMVTNIPALFLIKEGEVIGQMIGARPKEQILDFINQ